MKKANPELTHLRFFLVGIFFRHELRSLFFRSFIFSFKASD
jgi:hypothetical protein